MTETDTEFLSRMLSQSSMPQGQAADPDMTRLLKMAAEAVRLRVENIQMKFALGYPMPADLERLILPENPFKCGMCEARAALKKENTP